MLSALARYACSSGVPTRLESLAYPTHQGQTREEAVGQILHHLVKSLSADVIGALRQRKSSSPTLELVL
jgi:hypothetical protein